ncbi:MAG: hypothetical protein N3E45_07830 [Oscillatoriaceae bacterium SKW80]|nr:hypothetical protein [Oscillatoriaceae bacterium SKYG93]MCX8120727.1 hypothetical protein [Oscillatoriaceae bacterium SKW80]MDW8453735.1 hypothetical protein [Oscillatoriaceae cyanobacterium SKYGB_i_bin93]
MVTAIILLAVIAVAIALNAQLAAQERQKAERAVVPIPVRVEERS